MKSRRVLILPFASLFALVAIAQPGTLDPTFNGTGKVTTDIGSGNCSFHAVVVQPDGKIVAGGGVLTFVMQTSFLLARFNTDGSLDDTFGTDGITATRMTDQTDLLSQYGSGYDGTIQALALQPDGKVVVAGRCLIASYPAIGLARYNVDGTLDPTFGDAGIVLDMDGLGWPYGMAIQPDGKIVVTGASGFSAVGVYRYNADGSRDMGFGTGGVQAAQVNIYGHEARAVALQADGKILVGGHAYTGVNYDLFIMRFNEDGTPDPGFGGTGWITADPNGTDNKLYGMVVRADGKIVIGGTTSFSDEQFMVARFLSDGTPDGTFGTGGTTFTDVATGADLLNAFTQQTDGSLVACGTASSSSDIIVARYTGDGIPDATFSADGQMTIPLDPNSAEGNAVAMAPDGSIVVAGRSQIPGGAYGLLGTVARVAASGGLDVAFGGDGAVEMGSGIGGDQATAVAVQPDGRILVAANTANYSGSAMTVARYEADGSLDPTFGTDGIATISQDRPLCIAVQPDGKILVGVDFVFALYRLNSDGSVDPSFNGTGVQSILNFQVYEPVGGVRSIVVQPDGKILAAGYAAPFPISMEYFAVARFNPDGTLDTSFDGDGKVAFNFDFPGYDEIHSMALQPDGKIVVGGISDAGSGYAMARLLSDGTLDPAFSGDGLTIEAIDGIPMGIVVQPDGKILAAGRSIYTLDQDISVLRLNANGTPDASFGTSGQVMTDIAGGNEEGHGLLLQPDGKFIVCGFTQGATFEHFALVRYTASGALDAGFGTAGIVTTDFGDDYARAFDLAKQPDGKVVLAGVTLGASDQDIALARYITGMPVGISEMPGATLSQLSVWPDPVRNGSVVAFDLAAPDIMTIRLLDAHARPVRNVLTTHNFAAGHHEVVLHDVSDLAHGTYLVELQGAGERQQCKVIR